MPRSSFVTIHPMAMLRAYAALPPIRRVRLRLLVCSVVGVVAAATGCGGAEPLTIDAAPGELIAYTAGDGIHLATPDGGNDWKVPGAANLSGPRWAPDGRRFAAVDLSDAGKVYSVSVDGSEKERLPSEGSSTTPDWSPDGSRLAAVDEEDVRIQIVRIADGVIQAVLPIKGNDPAWSPDGRAIAFQSDHAGGPLRIYLATPTGRRVRRLTDARGGDEGETAAAWSPDGRWITFASDLDGDWEIYVIRTDGSGSRKLTDNSLADSSPSWSPEGSRLVFDRTWPNKTAIVVYDLEAGTETTIAGGGLGVGDLVFEPSWQPLPR